MFTEIEDLFLYILRDDSSKSEIEKRVRSYDLCRWQELYDFVSRSSLAAPFFIRLSRLKIESIPAGYIAKFKNIYLCNLKQNIRLEAELFKILDCLKADGIPAIPLKGTVLARHLYSDAGSRQASCDLDVLLKGQMFRPAIERLSRAGYIFSFNEEKKDFLQPNSLSGRINQAVLIKSSGDGFNIILDLHSRVRGFFSEEAIEDFWNQARYIDCDGRAILIPCHEDYLIYLCVISISSLESVQLKYIYDIHRLVTSFKRELDWEEVYCRADKLGLERCVYLPLVLSRDLFFTDIPGFFLDKVNLSATARMLLGTVVNRRTLLNFRERTRMNLLSRCILGRHLYSRNTVDFLSKAMKKYIHNNFRMEGR